MAEHQTTTKSSEQETETRNNNPILCFFSNFLKLFNLVLPPLPTPQKKQEKESAASSETHQSTTKDAPVVEETKPVVVTFPKQKEESLPSLKLEPDEVEERNTNPVVLWQVYAIGGFLVLRWAWTRWNERKARKKPSDDEPPPALE